MPRSENEASTQHDVGIVAVACSACFSDRGLQLDAERSGIALDTECPNCGSHKGKKLDTTGLEEIAHKFFVWGSLRRFEYGTAPRIQFNQHQKTSIKVSEWLQADLKVF